MNTFFLLDKAGGLDKLTLDSLYDDAMRRSNQPVSYNPWEAAPMSNPAMLPMTTHDPFYASNTVAAPPSVQMAAMANQQQQYMQQQQQQQMMMGQPQTANPFGHPYGGAGKHPYGMPVQAYSNPYSGLL